MLPPFRLSFVEVQRRGLKYARELVRAAVFAVESRDAEIARLREHIATLEAAKRVSMFTVDNPTQAPTGLWTLDAGRPQRVCTLAPGDRLLVLRAPAAVVVEAPVARGEGAKAHG